MALIPETPEELRGLLAVYGGEAYCPDCEAALDDVLAPVCPTCGEGVGCAPEYTPVRDKQ